MDKMTTDLQRSVLDALLQDVRTQELALEILDNNGVITLNGSVPSPDVSEAVEEIVKSVAGVTSIINTLEIRETD